MRPFLSSNFAADLFDKVAIVDFSQDVRYLFGIRPVSHYPHRHAGSLSQSLSATFWVRSLLCSLHLQRSCLASSGYEPRDVIGRPALELVHPEEFPAIRQLH